MTFQWSSFPLLYPFLYYILGDVPGLVCGSRYAMADSTVLPFEKATWKYTVSVNQNVTWSEDCRPASCPPTPARHKVPEKIGGQRQVHHAFQDSETQCPPQCLPTSQDFSAPASWGNNTLPAPKNGSLKGEPQINGTKQKLQKDSSTPKKVSSDKSGIRNQWVENKSNKWCLRNRIILTKRQVRVLSHILHQKVKFKSKKVTT